MHGRRGVMMLVSLAVVLAGCTPSHPEVAPTHPAGSPLVVIGTGTATVSGTATIVLTDNEGRTLYFRTPDTGSSCSGSCAATWPPLLASGDPQASAPVPGELGIKADANGSQVVYQGHPLYRFAGDTGPGTAAGNGSGGTWFAAIPTLKP